MYIALEGINGCGKSTQARMLYEYAVKKIGKDNVILTKEPTQGIYGKQIYKILIEKIQTSAVEMAMLFALDRREHHREVVDPAISQGKIVIGDRCIASSFAYQFGELNIRTSKFTDVDARNIFMSLIHSDMKMYKPDVLVVIDADIDKAHAKVVANGIPDMHESDAELEISARRRYLRMDDYLELEDFFVIEQLDTPELTSELLTSKVSKYIIGV